MVDLGSVTVSRGWSRYLSGVTARLIAIHLFTEHTHDMVLFIHQALILIDEDTNLILQCCDLILAAADCSDQRVGEGIGGSRGGDSPSLEVVSSLGGGLAGPKG